MHPIIDLHCDLLLYLAWKEGRTPFGLESRCAFPQLMAGGVKVQTVAIATTTSLHSVKLAQRQIEFYQGLLHLYSDYCIPFSGDLSNSKIQLIPAIENASGFALEDESLEVALERLSKIIQEIGPIFYISLTWNGENRFGGGMGANCGLKEDGKVLLEWLQGKKIAIDFSHTSDQLAHDILNYNDQKGLNLSMMASHSNFRKIADHGRNLPDEIIKELIHRKGIIGMNFIVPFLGSSDNLLEHIAHGFQAGAENALAFGGDFFCDLDFPDAASRLPGIPLFSETYPNASCYPSVLKSLSETFSAPFLENLSHHNALSFLTRIKA